MREKLDDLACRAISDMAYMANKVYDLKVACDGKNILTDEEHAFVDDILLHTLDTIPFEIKRPIKRSIATICKCRLAMITLKLECLYLRHKLRKIQKAEEA